MADEGGFATVVAEAISALNARLDKQQDLIDAQQAVLTALACALHKQGAVRIDDLRLPLRAVQLRAQVLERPGVPAALDLIASRLLALAEPQPDQTGPQPSPLQMLLTEAALHAAVPAHLRAAQTAWLAQATTEEIEQELQQILRGHAGRPEES